jgi:hypothetical protein
MEELDWSREAHVVFGDRDASDAAALGQRLGPRLFPSLTEAVRFTMEAIAEPDRRTVRIESGDEAFGPAEIAELYAKVRSGYP